MDFQAKGLGLGVGGCLAMVFQTLWRPDTHTSVLEYVTYRNLCGVLEPLYLCTPSRLTFSSPQK